MAEVMVPRTRSRAQAGEGATTASREEIARVAYELFERRGGTHGSDQQDWFEAERIIAARRRGGNGRQ